MGYFLMLLNHFLRHKAVIRLIGRVFYTLTSQDLKNVTEHVPVTFAANYQKA